jgi:LysM repeat protein
MLINNRVGTPGLAFDPLAQADLDVELVSYLVQLGDTLAAIAQQFNVALAAILGANPGLTDWEDLVPGQELFIPQPLQEAMEAEAAQALAEMLPGLRHGSQFQAGGPVPAALRREIHRMLETAPSGPVMDPSALTGAVLDRRRDPDAWLNQLARSPAFRQAMAEEADAHVFLGGRGSAKVGVDGGPARVDSPRDDGRTWLRTGGSLGFRDGGRKDALRGEGRFELTRPYEARRSLSGQVGLAREVVGNSTRDLPLTGDAARSLEPGSTFSLRHQDGRSLGVKRLDGDALETRTTLPGKRSPAFDLDLSKPGARRFYNQLVNLDPSKGPELARDPRNGVQVKVDPPAARSTPLTTPAATATGTTPATTPATTTPAGPVDVKKVIDLKGDGDGKLGENVTYEGRGSVLKTRETSADGKRVTDRTAVEGDGKVEAKVGEGSLVNGSVGVVYKDAKTKEGGVTTRERTVGGKGSVGGETTLGQDAHLQGSVGGGRSSTVTTRESKEVKRTTDKSGTFSVRGDTPVGDRTKVGGGVAVDAASSTTTEGGKVTASTSKRDVKADANLAHQVAEGTTVTAETTVHARDDKVLQDGKTTSTRTRDGTAKAGVEATLAQGVTGQADLSVASGRTTKTVDGKVVRDERRTDVGGGAEVSADLEDGVKATVGATARRKDVSVTEEGKTTRTTTSGVTGKAEVTVPAGQGSSVTGGTGFSVNDEVTAVDGETTKSTHAEEATAHGKVEAKVGEETDVSVGGSVREKEVTVKEGGKTTRTATTERKADASVSGTLGQDGSFSASGNARNEEVATDVDGKTTRTTRTREQAGEAQVEATVGQATTVKAGASTSRSDVTTTQGGETSREKSREDEANLEVGRPVGKDATATAGVGVTRTASQTLADGKVVTREEGRTVTGTVGLEDGSDKKGSLSGKVTVKAGRESALAEDGTRTEGRSTGTNVELSTKLSDKTTVGFTAGKSRSGTLSLPEGAPEGLAAPLTAQDALRLPQDATYTLQGEGKVAVTADTEGFKGGVSREATLDVEVTRGEGSRVDVKVEVTSTRGANAGVDRTLGEDEKKAVTVGLSGGRKTTNLLNETYALDLSKPDHQGAYDAALRGNLAPAQELMKKEGTVVRETGVNRRDELKFSASAGSWVGGSVELSKETLDTKDPRVAGDADRKAFSTGAAGGGQVTWEERAGALEAHGGVKDVSAPAGAANVTFGFQASKLVEYRSLTPSVDGKPVAETTKGPPVTAQGVLGMPRGAEFQLRGTATFQGETGVGFGHEAGAGGVRVGYNVGVETTKTHTAQLNVQVKRLEGNQVQVNLDKLKSDKTGADFTARIGAKVNGAELAAAGGSMLGALANKPEVGKHLGKLDKILTAEFRAGGSNTRTEGKGMQFTLDLGTEQGKAAYEKLVKGDTQAAVELSQRTLAGEKTGVALDKGMQSNTVEKERHAGLEIAGTKLFLVESLRKDSTTIVSTRDATERADESTYEKKSKNIIGRKRDLDWDAVRVTTPDDPKGKGYVRLRYTDSDPMTSRTELRERQRLAESLNAVPVKETRSSVTGNPLAKMFGGAHGKTKTEMDIFFTDQGMDNIRKSGKEAAIQAYGQSVAEQTREGVPAWAVPETATQARALMERYRHEPKTDRNNHPVTTPSERRYKELFGRDLEDEWDTYNGAMKFGASVDRMNRSAEPAEWNKSFATMGKEAGFDFFNVAGALNRLAGKDEVLVHRFQVKGDRVDLEMADEGLVSSPKKLTANQP